MCGSYQERTLDRKIECAWQSLAEKFSTLERIAAICRKCLCVEWCCPCSVLFCSLLLCPVPPLSALIMLPTVDHNKPTAQRAVAVLKHKTYNKKETATIS